MQRRLVTSLTLLLSACGPDTPSSDENQQRLKICQTVMQKYIEESHLNERDWKKTIGSCNISQLHRTLDQWQCVLKAMEGGQRYVDASDQCGSTPPTR